MSSLVGSFGWQDGDALRVSQARAKLPACSTDTVWTVASRHAGTLAPGTWPFPTPNAVRQVQGLDTEALPKFGKEKEARLLSGALSLRCLI